MNVNVSRLIRILRKLLIVATLLSYPFFYFFPTLESIEVGAIRLVATIVCLLLCTPGLWKILSFYFAHLAGAEIVSRKDLTLPGWLLDKLEGEAKESTKNNY